MKAYRIMAPFRIDPKIMQDPWNISHIMVYNSITFAEVVFEVGYESPEVLFFGVIIDGEDDQVGCDEEDDEEESQAKELF